MEDSSKFTLRADQVAFLKTKYADVPIVQRVLAAEKGLHFEISRDDDADFFLWLDAQSVETMDDNYEPTDDTYMIEGIIDYMHTQE